jgi:N-carbamoyl-L-amino-acid hydrolase
LKLSLVQTQGIASAVSPARLWRRHLEMSEFGARPDGGVNRQALSAADGAARVALIQWATAHGYACSSDAIGNIFVRREGRDAGLAPILAGSHLDTQPAGGRFDGAFGVLATLEALQALDAAGVESLRPIELVSWTNEEGSRFSPGTMGSSLFAGALRLDEVLGLRDKDGIVLADALKDVLALISDIPRRPFQLPVAAYLEPHIEQGPVLETHDSTIGIASGIQGIRWFEIDVVGAEAHAGTTPTAARHDALQTAVSIIHELANGMADPTDMLRFTVGRIVVEPNSPNTIPGRAFFTVDLRHPDAAQLDVLANQVVAVSGRLAGRCKVTVSETLRMSPTKFDAGLMDMLGGAASALDLPHLQLVSGAFHDAAALSAICPSAMIFIPCAQGISHSPRESIRVEDAAAGARVLALTLAELSLMDDRMMAERCPRPDKKIADFARERVS